MANFNRVFHDISAVDNSESSQVEFWKEVGVNFELNKEKSPKDLNIILSSRLNSSSSIAIKEIAELSEIELDEKETKGNNITHLCGELSEPEKLRLFNLIQYSSRKKKSINDYFEFYLEDEKVNLTDSLSKLYLLFQKSPSHLFSIGTLNMWQNHASGTLYGFDQELKKSDAKKMVTEINYEKKLRNRLYKASNERNNYKIHSYCEYDGIYIVQLYKETNDVTKEDFNGAIRNREITKILFAIDTNNNLIEIKTKANFEKNGIKEYLEETFKGTATEVKEEIFDKVDQKQIKDSILKGKTALGEQVGGFIVDRIKFRESPLENSPSLAFSLKGIDISQSVYDAYEKGAINISSIKSVESISFNSNGTRRTVFSSILDNGNIIFQMDDSRMDKDKKAILEEKFLNRFGFPLYKQISNVGSTDGDADLVDYIIKNRDTRNLSIAEKEKQEELFGDKLLKEKSVLKSVCTDSTCHYEEIIENNEDLKEECPDCEGEIKTFTEYKVFINVEKIKKYVVSKLNEVCNSSDWEYQGASTRTVGGTPYHFYKLKNSREGKVLKILVSTETISGSTLRKLKKFLDPTLIISVGQGSKAIERYSSGCFSAISFGNFYERDSESLSDFLEKAFQTLELKTKDYIAAAASESYANIKEKVTNPKVNKYKPSDYEDDVYTILKDLFINVQKWGHEYNGQELPEGIFTLYFDKKQGKKAITNKLAFSYDCKLNTNLDGYEFSIAEKDKAIRYIKSLSDTVELSEFTDSNHLDGHIIVSNKFKEKNASNTYKSIKADISKNYDTEMIFLSNDALMSLHEQYRTNFSLIESSKDLFLNMLSDFLLASEGTIIKEEHVKFMIGKILKQASKKAIDFPELTVEMTEDLHSIFKI